jgi:two-component system sensor histidine kinase/response regulator
VSANGSSWDAACALERLGGDADLFREIIQIFLQEAPKHMTELQEALVHGDRAATERIAHTLKGELSCLGILQASRNASELEDAGRDGDLERAASIHTLLEKDLETLVTTMRYALAGKTSSLSLVQPSGAN